MALKALLSHPEMKAIEGLGINLDKRLGYTENDYMKVFPVYLFPQDEADLIYEKLGINIFARQQLLSLTKYHPDISEEDYTKHFSKEEIEANKKQHLIDANTKGKDWSFKFFN